MNLPLFLKKYFWDVDFKTLDVKKHAVYIIERILEYGDEKAVIWLKKNMPIEIIRKTLINCRSLSPQSANLWAILLDIPKQKILCLKKPFLKKRSAHWIW